MLILDALWNGELDPMGQRHHDREIYSNAFRNLEHAEAALKAELTEAGITALEAFTQAQLDSACLYERDGFIGGFRLGVQLILDALLEPSKARS